MRCARYESARRQAPAQRLRCKTGTGAGTTSRRQRHDPAYPAHHAVPVVRPRRRGGGRFLRIGVRQRAHRARRALRQGWRARVRQRRGRGDDRGVRARRAGVRRAERRPRVPDDAGRVVRRQLPRPGRDRPLLGAPVRRRRRARAAMRLAARPLRRVVAGRAGADGRADDGRPGPRRARDGAGDDDEEARSRRAAAGGGWLGPVHANNGLALAPERGGRKDCDEAKTRRIRDEHDVAIGPSGGRCVGARFPRLFPFSRPSFHRPPALSRCRPACERRRPHAPAGRFFRRAAHRSAPAPAAFAAARPIPRNTPLSRLCSTDRRLTPP
ncbi:hypothetical protein F01_10089 [Burkholderia cenocepacia]|nr:hypothetical protein F01_10089 [Burkholderia cenocepacia]